MIRWLKPALIAASLLGATSVSARQAQWRVEPGVYTNEEQVYFEAEATGKTLPWVGVHIVSDDGQPPRVRFFDALGNKTAENPDIVEALSETTYPADGKKIKLSLPGRTIMLRKARPVTCWSAIPKDAKKADGSVDWFFAQGIKIHDQGGRALVGGGDSGAKPVVIRMRNVVWPPKPDGSANTNRPSLVLYIHTPDEPDKAVSYVWADPEATRIGINLRWMQASCTVDGAE